MSAHTPGPWKCETPGDCIVAVDGTHVVCFGHDYDDYGYLGNVADARLIAAAPELLAALKALSCSHTGQCWCEHGRGNPMMRNHSSACADARAAIAKAEGQ